MQLLTCCWRCSAKEMQAQMWGPEQLMGSMNDGFGRVSFCGFSSGICALKNPWQRLQTN